MKILANRKIKALFYKIMVCMLIFIVVSVSFMMFELNNAALYILLCALFMCIAIMAACYGYFKEQNEIMENAVAQITEYISGNRETRIECDEEGEMYQLFHEVNSLAAILDANVENERKSKQFLKNTISDISHQLKTPLAALNIYNGILQGEAENQPTIQEFTMLSEQELDRIETLVQNLLKITKLDAGTIVMDRQSENMAEMMETVRKHFAFRAECEGKEIRLTGDCEITLLCDRVWMIEAIDNIVKNALDHTKEGGLVQVSWRESASAVRLTVRDNGSGIHSEDLYHIFKRFYRSRFSKDTQGIGLGLPLSKSIIEAHNGTIEVDSIEGRGTAFVITI